MRAWTLGDDRGFLTDHDLQPATNLARQSGFLPNGRTIPDWVG
jgi:hypothetical protein